MSLESFSRSHSEYLIEPNPSIENLAVNLLVHCRDGALSIGRKYGSTLTREDEAEFFREAAVELAGILVADTVLETKGTLDSGSGVFDLRGYIEKVKIDLTGLPLKLEDYDLPEDLPEVVEIEHDDLIRMRAIHSEDKSYSRFLEQRGSLPREVERYLDNYIGIWGSDPLKKVLSVWKKVVFPHTQTTALQKTEDTSTLPQPFRKPSSGSNTGQSELTKEEQDRLLEIVKEKKKDDETWIWKEKPQDN